jgi:hypothetical protein
MSKHTATPWHVELVQEFPFGVRVLSQEIPIYWQDACCFATNQKSRRDNEIGVGFPREEVKNVQDLIGQQDANAAYIVRCVNAHEALLAALKEIATHDDDNSSCFHSSHSGCLAAIKTVARTAIALAESPP